MRFCYDGHITIVKLIISRVFAYCCVCVSASRFAFYWCETKKMKLFHVFSFSGKTFRFLLLRGEKCKVRCETHKVDRWRTLHFHCFTPGSCRLPCSADLTVRVPFHHIFNTFQSRTSLFSRAPMLSLHLQTSVLSVSYHETIQNRLQNASFLEPLFCSKIGYSSFSA